MHEYISIALGIIVSGLSFLLARLLGKLDKLEESIESHDRQIRDTRTAIAECRTAQGLPSYPYTE